jgi:DNA replication protein DnaC
VATAPAPWAAPQRAKCACRASAFNGGRKPSSLRLQRQLAIYKLLIIDELGYVPLSTTGAELLFEVFSQRYERGSTIVTSNLPFDEWTIVFGSERLTGALLDRLTHQVHILEMNGDSYRLKQSKQRLRRT